MTPSNTGENSEAPGFLVRKAMVNSTGVGSSPAPLGVVEEVGDSNRRFIALTITRLLNSVSRLGLSAWLSVMGRSTSVT